MSSSSSAEAGLRSNGLGGRQARSLALSAALSLTRFVAQSSAGTPSESDSSRVHYRRDPTKGKVDREGTGRLPNWTEPGAEALQSFHIASQQLLRTLPSPNTNTTHITNTTHQLRPVPQTTHPPQIHNPPKSLRNSPSATCPSTPRK